MQIELRKPEFVMKLNRLGSFHQSKLSFLRSFIREFKDWDFETKEISLDQMGFGHCVYVVKNGSKQYSLICFSNYLDDGERSDRVIATKWDVNNSWLFWIFTLIQEKYLIVTFKYVLNL